MTAYRGIYVLKDSSGRITDVQVVSQPDGNSLPLEIEKYRARNVPPEAETLPDQHQYPEVAKRNQQIHEVALNALYPSQAAIFGRGDAHPDSAVDRDTIAKSTAIISSLGGKVVQASDSGQFAALTARLVVVDASGLAVRDNVRVF